LPVVLPVMTPTRSSVRVGGGHDPVGREPELLEEHGVGGARPEVLDADDLAGVPHDVPPAHRDRRPRR
jgi:hypothetical protein